MIWIAAWVLIVFWILSIVKAGKAADERMSEIYDNAQDMGREEQGKIQQNGTETLDSIPDDYTSLS